MKAKLWSAAQFVFGVALFGLLAWLALAGIRGFGNFLQGLDSDLARAVVAAGATVTASVIALIGSKAYEARIAIRQELRVKKIPIYEDIVHTLLYRIMFASILKKPEMPEDELMEFFAQATQQLTIWGSDPLLKTWGTWKTQAAGGLNPEAALFQFEDLLLAIRKDLGHRNRGLGKGSVLRMFVTDIDDYLKK